MDSTYLKENIGDILSQGLAQTVVKGKKKRKKKQEERKERSKNTKKKQQQELCQQHFINICHTNKTQ